jgi:hypothetical protein
LSGQHSSSQGNGHRPAADRDGTRHGFAFGWP